MRLFLCLIMVSLLACCTSTKNKQQSESTGKSESEMNLTEGRPITIYKTRSDYSGKVSVGLSKDKSQIISYPHPKDVFYNGKLALPTKLEGGYLLDNLGIGIHSGYLSISLEAYSKYEKAPSLDEMYGMLIDKDPFTELHRCGNGPDNVSELNRLIREGQLNQCKDLLKD